MNKKSIFYMVLISLMVLITFSNFAMKTRAHGPNMMNLGVSSGFLNVLIGHEVDDPNTHYVDQVKISVNGSEVLTTSYTNQSLTSGGSYQYPLVYDTGSLIEVIARCNEGGSITACLNVGVGGGCPQSSTGPQIPGYFGLWLILGFSIIAAIVVTYKKIRY